MKPFNKEDFKVGDYLVVDEKGEFDPFWQFFQLERINDNEIFVTNPNTYRYIGFGGVISGHNDFDENSMLRLATNLEKILAFMYFFESHETIVRFFIDAPKPNKSDEALLKIFLMHRHTLNDMPLDGYFHKAFRQIDVIEEKGMDSVVHTLLDDAPLFWYYFEQYKDKET